MKSRKIVSAFIVGLLFSFTGLNAQLDQAQNESKFKHSLGAGAGFTTGYGLSYRYMPKKFGAQVNFAPYKTSSYERYSLGVTLLYNLIETRAADLYVYQGNHFYSYSQDIYILEPGGVNGITVRDKDSYFNNGLGLGIEFIIAKRIGLNLMGGYAYYRNFTEINFTGEAGLYFKF